MYSTEIMKFIYWEQASRDTIDFKKTYVDLAEDLIAGLLLSQIIYWHLPSKETGKTKLRVKKEGHYWLAKGRNEWWEEIRISPKQFDRASKILVQKGLIEKKLYKFDGRPIPHIRLIWENFLPQLESVIYGEKQEEIEEKEEKEPVEPLSDMDFTQRVKSILPKGEKRNYPKGKMEFDQRGKSLTENTTKITSKINTENQSIKESAIPIDSSKDKKEKNDRLTDLQLINNKKEKTKEQKILELQNVISDKKELPIPVAKPMMMYTERLIDDEIDIEDIASVYFANKEIINEYQFGNILSNVLYETKGKIRNISALLYTAIKNYFKDINEIEHLKDQRPKEILPDWFVKKEHEKQESVEDNPYNLEGARDRFSDIFNF